MSDNYGLGDSEDEDFDLEDVIGGGDDDFDDLLDSGDEHQLQPVDQGGHDDYLSDEELLGDEQLYLEQISKAHQKAKARTSGQPRDGQPGINQKSRELDARSGRGLHHLKKDLKPLSANYGELLYEEFKSKDKARAKSLKEAQRQQDAEERAERSKPPVHTWASSRRNHNSIDVRSQIASETREKKLAQLRDKIDADNGVTFTPKINETKGQRRESLLKEMKMRERRRQQKLLALQEAVLAHEESSFTPQINEFSKSLVRDEPVHERLFRLQKEKEIAATLRQVQASEDLRVDPETGQRMFQPQINCGGGTERPECVEEALYRDAENRRLRKEMVQEQTALQDKMLRAAHKMTSYSKKLVQAKTERELRKVFGELDTEERGWLTYQEVALAVKKLGLFGQSGRHHRNTHERAILQKVWSAVDPEQTGSVTEENFVMFMGHVLGFDSKNAPEVPEHMLRAARELGAINTTKLSYTQIGHTKLDSGAADEEEHCSFKPKINPHSEELAKDANKPGKPTQRHEVLYQKALATKKKKQDALLEQRDRELEGCTFKPKINKTTARMAAGRGKEEKSHFEYLYKASKNPTKEQIKTSEERELEEHCTFKPKVKKPTRTPASARAKRQPRNVPRGYEQSVNRLRQANDEREMQRKEEERFYSTEEYQANRARFQSVKPFEFALDNRKERPTPVLVMEVNLGVGKSGRIGIYEGDEPAVLAHNFATTYQLDDEMCMRLEQLIIDQLQQAGHSPARDNLSPSRSEQSYQDEDLWGSDGDAGDSAGLDAEVAAREKLRKRQERIINSRKVPSAMYSDDESDEEGLF